MLKIIKGYRIQYLSFCSKVWPERIFSGIQPTGGLHIGNYFGAIENWVKLQNEGRDVMYSVVDLHSITLPYEKDTLPDNIFLVLASILGCGIDPEKSTVFLQSMVPYHTQLAWVLGCLTTMPRLGQLPQFKEKSLELKDVPLGIYLYPVLQAADILLYKSTLVPIGEDQVRHLQLASDLARKFNTTYGETFPRPESLLQGKLGCRLKNLRCPTLKMSKSYFDEKSRIELTDAPDVIVAKLKKAVTDCTSTVSYDPEIRPGVSNLVAIHSLATCQTPEDICDQVVSLNTGQYKMVVAEALIEKLKPIRKKTMELLNAKDYLRSVLSEGSLKAISLAETTWNEVALKIGIKC